MKRKNILHSSKTKNCRIGKKYSRKFRNKLFSFKSLVTHKKKKEMKEVVIAMGGAFNPVHSQHVAVMEAAKRYLFILFLFLFLFILPFLFYLILFNLILFYFIALSHYFIFLFYFIFLYYFLYYFLFIFVSLFAWE